MNADLTDQEIDDIRIAARFLRGSSWPLDMAQAMDDRADRLEALVDHLTEGLR